MNCTWQTAPALILACAATALAAGEPPTDNPAATLYKDQAPAWTGELKWANVVSIGEFAGATVDEQLRKAQEALKAKGGGVVYFPAGTYAFKDHVLLEDGIVVRGAPPQGVTDAKDEKYDPPTKFELPRYNPVFEGQGTPVEAAFKGVRLADPVGGRLAGIVDVALDHAHVELGTGRDFSATFEAGRRGGKLVVLGCLLKNAAIPDPAIPMLKIPKTETDFQHAWQRWTHRHHAAIEVYTGRQVLIANNRLPASGEDNFVMKDYKLCNNTSDGQWLRDPAKLKVLSAEVTFDFDNRPGISVNFMALSKGLAIFDAYANLEASKTPPQAGEIKPPPAALAPGIVIRDNYVFCDGCTGIRSSGEGTVIARNVIRFKPGVVLPTARGYQFDHFTNNNRAVEIRGWRWTLEGNDYEVHSNRTTGGGRYGDGEGMMHEAFDNCGVLESKAINNKGNAYICIWRVPVEGLLIQGNQVDAIKVFCEVKGGKTKFPCHRLQVIGNKTGGQVAGATAAAGGGGIGVMGGPATESVIKDNVHQGPGGRLDNPARAEASNNQGYQ